MDAADYHCKLNSGWTCWDLGVQVREHPCHIHYDGHWQQWYWRHLPGLGRGHPQRQDGQDPTQFPSFWWHVTMCESKKRRMHHFPFFPCLYIYIYVIMYMYNVYSLPLPGSLESKMDRNWCHVLVAPNSRCLLTVMSLLGVQQALARLTGERG